MKSIWENNCEIKRRESLNGSVNTSTLVIGAGMAGLLTAYRLKSFGEDVIVIDSSLIGSGQTKNTTAKITSQHGCIYHKLIRLFGTQLAAQYARANEQAVREFERIVKIHSVDCDFKILPSFIYSLQNKDKIVDEFTAANSLGIDVVLHDSVELPFSVAASLEFKNQAQFSPLKFIKFTSENLTVYENTPAVSIDKHNVVTVPNGKINAKNIVFACHYPFVNFPGLFFARMHQERSYVLALENCMRLNAMYKCIDEGGCSMRSFGDTLLFGGEKHRTGEGDGNHYEKLLKSAREIFPNCKEIMRWSAQDCKTADSVPYIGKYPGTSRSWYVATGFDKWGMTSSMVSSVIISDLLQGKNSPNAEIFAPNKFRLHAVPKIACESGTAVKNLCKEKFTSSKLDISEIPIGGGGIVNYNGETVGVYRKSEGDSYFVSTKCPHLGCRLAWNGDELSWDCPCHGSRFDYMGNPICGPAQASIKIDVTL